MFSGPKDFEKSNISMHSTIFRGAPHALHFLRIRTLNIASQSGPHMGEGWCAPRYERVVLGAEETPSKGVVVSWPCGRL